MRIFFLFCTILAAVLAIAAIVFGAINGFTVPVIMAVIIGLFVAISSLYWGYIRRGRTVPRLPNDKTK